MKITTIEERINNLRQFADRIEEDGSFSCIHDGEVIEFSGGYKKALAYYSGDADTLDYLENLDEEEREDLTVIVKLRKVQKDEAGNITGYAQQACGTGNTGNFNFEDDDFEGAINGIEEMFDIA